MGGVKVLDVVGRGGGKRLDLALADPLPAGPFDRLPGLLERAAGCLDRGQAAQPVRVRLAGQVELRVGGIEVGVPAVPIRQPGHRDRAEDAAQPAGVPGLHGAVSRALAITHLRQPLFPRNHSAVTHVTGVTGIGAAA